jgi:hypothetical protein
MSENVNENLQFRRADEKLLVALAGGASIRKAARVARVCQATVSRRLDDPAFKKRLGAIRDKFLDRAIGRLAATATAASATLRKLLKAKSETVRLGAARSILELHCRLKEHAELEAKLSDLAEEVARMHQRQAAAPNKRAR